MQNNKNKLQNIGKGRIAKTISVDGLVKRVEKKIIKKPTQKVKLASTVSYKSKTITSGKFFLIQKLYKEKRVPVLAAVLALIIAFGGGMWSVFATSKTNAEGEPQVLAASTDQQELSPKQSVLTVSESPVANSSDKKIPNSVLLNLTIGQLEGYLTEAIKTPELKQAEILAERKAKLKVYLAERGSPFVDIVDTIAELKHWKLVLAISNSESTLGKRCYTNNCSGIGVAPGDPLWREYRSTAEWAKDLDRLIDKRYKDWKLEDMNGVYNKPGSSNWVLAAKQVLEGLQDRGIE